MRVIGESVFDVLYLILVIAMGLHLLKDDRYDHRWRLFGIMALVLGVGDAFHLVPRVYELIAHGEALNTPAVGIGKMVTSISMTIFYVMLYHVWRTTYQAGCAKLTAAVYSLAILRIALCAFPQNQWTSPDPSYLWGIVRNIPFVLLGALIIWIFYHKRNDYAPFRRMWLAIALSFAFYIPVVLWADFLPAIGLLMLPKTVAYLWAVYMGIRASRQ